MRKMSTWTIWDICSFYSGIFKIIQVPWDNITGDLCSAAYLLSLFVNNFTFIDIS